MYRVPDEREVDGEALAVTALLRRVRFVRLAVWLTVITPCLAVAPFGYVYARDLQFQLLHLAWPAISAGVGVGVPFFGGLFGAEAIARALIAALIPRWIARLAERHGVLPRDLEPYASPWRGRSRIT